AERQFHGDGLPALLLDLGRHEPGRNTGPGGDGLPDFLRRAGDFELGLQGTATGSLFLHAHDCSLGVLDDAERMTTGPRPARANRTRLRAMASSKRRRTSGRASVDAPSRLTQRAMADPCNSFAGS